MLTTVGKSPLVVCFRSNASEFQEGNVEFPPFCCNFNRKIGGFVGGGIGGVDVRRAWTRFGWVSFSVDEKLQTAERIVAGSGIMLVANVTLSLHGRGFVAATGGLLVPVRLRDPNGTR